MRRTTALLILLLAVATVTRSVLATSAITSPDALAITGATDVAAGGITPLTVSTATDRQVTVRIISGRGDHVEHVDPVDGRATFAIGPPVTNSAGKVTVLISGQRGLLRHDINVRPGRPAETMRLFVGPRTVGPDGSTMAIALVTDALGNPVADGTPATFRVSNPAGKMRNEPSTTERGTAVFRLAGEGVAGIATLSSTTEAGSSGGEPVQFQPGVPLAPVLRLGALQPGPLLADGRSLLTITSNPVTDATGQPLRDGVSVTLVLDGPHGAGFVSGTIRAGQVQALVPAPASSGDLQIRALLQGVTGPPLTIPFRPAVAPFTYTTTVDDRGTTLEVGPVQATTGGLVPDGTLVALDGSTHALVNGRADIRITDQSPIQVQVLGVEGTETP